MSCIAINSTLRSQAKDLGITPESLVMLAYNYQKENNSEEFPSDEWIKKQLKQDSIHYISVEDLDISTKFPKESIFQSSTEALQYLSDLKTIFGNNAGIEVQLSDGAHKVIRKDFAVKSSSKFNYVIKEGNLVGTNVPMNNQMIDYFLNKIQKDNPYHQLFNQLITILKNNNIPINIVLDYNLQSIAARAQDGFKSATIQFNPDKLFLYLSKHSDRNSESEILKILTHELVHSVSAELTVTHPSWGKLRNFTEAQQKFTTEVNDIYEDALSQASEEDKAKWNGFKNTTEFVAEANSNREFQIYLASLKSSKNKKQSVFKRFINAITQLFNDIFAEQGIDIKDSILEDILSISQEYFEIANNDLSLSTTDPLYEGSRQQDNYIPSWFSASRDLKDIKNILRDIPEDQWKSVMSLKLRNHKFTISTFSTKDKYKSDLLGKNLNVINPANWGFIFIKKGVKKSWNNPENVIYSNSDPILDFFTDSVERSVEVKDNLRQFYTNNEEYIKSKLAGEASIESLSEKDIDSLSSHTTLKYTGEESNNIEDTIVKILQSGKTIEGINILGSSKNADKMVELAIAYSIPYTLYVSKNYNRYDSTSNSVVQSKKKDYIASFNTNVERKTVEKDSLPTNNSIVTYTEGADSTLISVDTKNYDIETISNSLKNDINGNKIKIGNTIILSTDSLSEEYLYKMYSALNELENSNYIVRNGKFIEIPVQAIENKETSKLFSKIGKFDKEKGTYSLPLYNVGYTDSEKELLRQSRNLLESGRFRASELQKYATLAIYKFSADVTKLLEDREFGKKLFSNLKGYEKWADIDFTQMSRAQLFDAAQGGIGLNNLFEALIKEQVFNQANRSEEETDNMKVSTLNKLQDIYDNFQAFLRLTQTALASMENISLSSMNIIQEINETLPDASENDYDLTSQDIQEIYGSEAERWQVGFRQISAVSSLARLVKEKLSNVYKIDAEGNYVQNELGQYETIDSTEIVTSILAWCQDAPTLSRMIKELQSRVAAYPWLNQLVGTYTDLEGNTKQGILLQDNQEFLSQFFTDVRKYFQPYAIIIKGDNGIVMKGINTAEYVDSSMGYIENKLKRASLGEYRLYDKKFKQATKDYDTLISLIKELDTLNNSKEVNSQVYENISKIINLLDIDNISTERLKYLYHTSESISEFSTIAKRLVNNIHTALKDGNFNTSEIKNEYKNILTQLSVIQSTALESVNYETGKMYYSYVVPNFLSKQIKKLQGLTISEDSYEEYIEKEFGSQIGWFAMPEEGQYDGLIHNNPWGNGKYLNTFLNRVLRDPKAREVLKHVAVLQDQKTEYTEKSAGQYAASMLTMYNAGGNNYGYYAIPIMSNKPSEEYIRMDKYDSINSIISELCGTILISEINRIRTVRSSEYQNSTNTIDNFKKNGVNFMFLPFLNKYLNNEISQESEEYQFAQDFQAFVLGTKEVSNMKTFIESMPNIIAKELNNQFINFLESLKNYGVFKEYSISGYDGLYAIGNIKDWIQKTSVSSMEELQLFFYNNFLARTNFIQLFAGDLAFFKNAEDFQKRAAQWHSPGIVLNLEAKDPANHNKNVSDGYHRSVTIDDIYVPSEVKGALMAVKESKLSAHRDAKGNLDTIGIEIEKMFDDIAEGYNGINFGDGQSFTSPTSVRKKLTMLGQWNDTKEEAYQRIKSGKYTRDDIFMLSTILKPFTTGLLDRRNPEANNTYMPNFKVPFQLKTSEYMILFLDALGAEKDSPLAGILEVLENSANNVGSDKCLDDIHFHSVIKEGSQNSIDISGMNKAQVVELLESRIYGANKSEYNEDVVITTSFENWSEQQKNPAHFTGEMNFPSQSRIISISDFDFFDASGNPLMITKSDGTKESVQDAQMNYMQLVADNIKLSVQILNNRLALDVHNPKLRNIILSRLLQEEILRDGRSDSELLWACSTNENGEFNIPLSDPIHAGRIQQLLNSLVKKYVSKPTIAGGGVVQVTSFGLDNTLSMRFLDKEGRPLKSMKEYAEEFNNFTEEEIFEGYQEYLEDNVGSLSHLEVLAPCPDPSWYDKFPKLDENGKPTGEIDIDLVRQANPKALELLCTRIPTEDKYSSLPCKIVGFLPIEAGEAIMFPKEITLLTGSDFDVDKMYTSRFALNTTKDGRLVLDESPYQSNNNKILDYQIAFARNPQALEGQLNHGNFDALKEQAFLFEYMRKTGKTLSEALNTSPEERDKEAKAFNSIVLPQTQLSFFANNMEAAKMIGVFAQANISHSYLSLYRTDNNEDMAVQLRKGASFAYKDERGEVHTTYEVEKKGSFMPIDMKYTWNGIDTIAKELASSIGASVDAVKDPVFNYLNIDMNSINIYTTLIRMGMPLKEVAAIMTTPVMRTLFKVYKSNPEFKYTSLSDFISLVTDGIMNKTKGIRTEGFILDYNDVVAMHNDDSAEYRTINEYADSLSDEDAINVIGLLDTIYAVVNIAEKLRDIQHYTRYNSSSASTGPMMAQTILQSIKLNNVKWEQFTPTVTKVFNNPALEAFRRNGFNLNNILQGDTIYGGEVAYRLLNTAFELLNGNIDDKKAISISNFLLNTVLSQGEVFNNTSEDFKYYIFEFPNKFNTLKSQYPENDLLNAISFGSESYGNKKSISVLKLNTRGMKSENIENIKKAWADLYWAESNAGKSVKDNLAMQLVMYNFARGGATFNPKTFSKIIPNELRILIPNYIKSIREFQNSEISNGILSNMIYQWSINEGKPTAGIVDSLGIDEELNTFLQEEYKKKGSGAIVNKQGYPKIDNITGTVYDKNTKRYYVVYPYDKKSVRIAVIDKLGGNNNALEFNINIPIEQLRSIFTNEVQPQSKKEGKKQDTNSVMKFEIPTGIGIEETPLQTSKNNVSLSNREIYVLSQAISAGFATSRGLNYSINDIYNKMKNNIDSNISAHKSEYLKYLEVLKVGTKDSKLLQEIDNVTKKLCE